MTFSGVLRAFLDGMTLMAMADEAFWIDRHTAQDPEVARLLPWLARDADAEGESTRWTAEEVIHDVEELLDHARDRLVPSV